MSDTVSRAIGDIIQNLADTMHDAVKDTPGMIYMGDDFDTVLYEFVEQHLTIRLE